MHQAHGASSGACVAGVKRRCGPCFALVHRLTLCGVHVRLVQGPKLLYPAAWTRPSLHGGCHRTRCGLVGSWGLLRRQMAGSSDATAGQQAARPRVANRAASAQTNEAVAAGTVLFSEPFCVAVSLLQPHHACVHVYVHASHEASSQPCSLHRPRTLTVLQSCRRTAQRATPSIARCKRSRHLVGPSSPWLPLERCPGSPLPSPRLTASPQCLSSSVAMQQRRWCLGSPSHLRSAR